jgi:leucyl aminopeptidase
MAQLPSITFTPLSAEARFKTLVYFLSEGEGSRALLDRLDSKTNGAISRAIDATAFKPKLKSMLEILAPYGLDAGRLLFAGVGDTKALTERDWMEIGGAVRGKLSGRAIEAGVLFEGLEDTPEDAPLSFALGFNLRNYSFKKYKSKKANGPENGESSAESEPEEAPRLTILSPAGSALNARFAHNLSISEGVYFARDLVNEPANILTPPEFASRLRGLEAQGIKVEVLDGQAMKALGMNAILAVGQGSAQPSFTVVMRWDGRAQSKSEADDNLVFIGKGVCFDTGGISIKPAAGMEDMKGDMGGAAAVAGVMLALAKRRAPVRAIGLVGLVENMPSATAQRPGDVVTAASGKTIEVINTDAEGRLVLADLLWYAQTRLSPRFMVTLATLTGAIIVALGKEHAGLFSNNDELSDRITEAGLDTGEQAWRLPLSKKYNKLIESKIADMKNIGGRDAGSITAAQFLQRFVDDGKAWAHLDIAGTAMASPATDINQSWASGYGVRLLDRLSSKFYEA